MQRTGTFPPKDSAGDYHAGWPEVIQANSMTYGAMIGPISLPSGNAAGTVKFFGYGANLMAETAVSASFDDRLAAVASRCAGWRVLLRQSGGCSMPSRGSGATPSHSDDVITPKRKNPSFGKPLEGFVGAARRVVRFVLPAGL